jgi:hypothetical protein
VQQLVNSLAAGEVGCLAPDAVFTETVSVLNRPGTSDQPFVVRSESPDHPATISATSDPATLSLVYIGASASHFSFVGVNIHAVAGPHTPAVTIAGNANAVVGADITNPTNSTCVQIGPDSTRRATGASLEGDSIHSCGSTGGRADGLIIGYADNTHISHSYVYGNPRFGVTLFPDAQHSVIDHNVIDRQHNGMGDGEGVHFAGDDTFASKDNLVVANMISDNETHNIGYNWNDGTGPVGTGNVVRGNCISNSGNTAGEFQTDPGTHQPVGYTEEQNRVGSDPQYVNRDAPPAGYALGPGSPCRDYGPLATVVTSPVVLPAPDPEAVHVFTASLAGEINPHLQPATFHFEVGTPTGALAPLAGQQVGAFGMPVAVASAPVTDLKPSTTYSYRIVPDSPAGSDPGQTLTFTTAAAPLLAPPIATLSYSPKLNRRAKVVLTGLALTKLPRGAQVKLRCSPRPPCPFTERTGVGALPLLRHTAFGRGARIYIEVDQAEAIGRYRGRATALTVGRITRGKLARVKRSDGCVLVGGSQVTCLRPVARRILNYKTYARFEPPLTALGVPPGAKVDYACIRGKCPKFPSCRIVSGGFKKLALLGKTQRVKAGVVFDVRFLKPNTRGLVARFTVRRGSHQHVVTSQKNSFLPASVQHAGQCRDA